MDLDHPLERVWPQVLDIGGWMSDHRLETLAGEPGKVGHFERVHPSQLGADVPPPHYHLYGITEIIPFKLLAFEVFPERGGSYGKTGNKISFDSILLTPAGQSTRLTFLMIDVILEQPKETGEALRARHQRENEGSSERLRRYFENLRQRVDRSDEGTS
jgi:hypothetical protein